MGFLDNSGDIVLDAVLTDAGRQRLARGDGSFKVVQFALGDDEINYGLFDLTASTANQDLSILQTPILEAFTNNIASLNSKLLSLPRNDFEYLPVIKIGSNLFNGTTAELKNTFVVTVDSATETAASLATSDLNKDKFGVIYGFGISNSDAIQLYQGLDTSAIPFNQTIDPDLRETQYIVEIDNRLGTIISTTSQPGNILEAVKSFVDDDEVAQYYFSEGVDTAFVESTTTNLQSDPLSSIIAGPKGTRLQFSIRANLGLANSSYLFNQLGQSITIDSSAYKVIKTSIVVTGATTGYSVTIPVSFIKKS
jgi:hypothetical protein